MNPTPVCRNVGSHSTRRLNSPGAASIHPERMQIMKNSLKPGFTVAPRDADLSPTPQGYSSDFNSSCRRYFGRYPGFSVDSRLNCPPHYPQHPSHILGYFGLISRKGRIRKSIDFNAIQKCLDIQASTLLWSPEPKVPASIPGSPSITSRTYALNSEPGSSHIRLGSMASNPWFFEEVHRFASSPKCSTS